jgi:hypothetical protein
LAAGSAATATTTTSLTGVPTGRSTRNAIAARNAGASTQIDDTARTIKITFDPQQDNATITGRGTTPAITPPTPADWQRLATALVDARKAIPRERPGISSGPVHCSAPAATAGSGGAPCSSAAGARTIVTAETSIAATIVVFEFQLDRIPVRTCSGVRNLCRVKVPGLNHTAKDHWTFDHQIERTEPTRCDPENGALLDLDSIVLPALRRQLGHGAGRH